MTTNSPAAAPLRVLIIGAGFAGVGLAIQLQKRGIEDFLVLEKAASVGGTWRDNHYPGAACDVPSHLYSYSFEPKTDWSRKFAPQAEIVAYIQHCVDKHQLAGKIRCNTEVASAEFEQASGLWRVIGKNGEHYLAQALVSACGQLNQPAYPRIPGLESFAGEAFHSARWNHAYDLAGKRVAVIGTGASAIQFVPELQKQVAQLDLYQRTAPWIMPKPDREISARERNRFQRLPLLQKAWRGLIYGLLESRVIGFAMAPRIMKVAEWVSKGFIKRSIKDPVLRAKVTPNYRMGCKRVLISNNYYPALAQANVNVISDGIREIRANSIVTSDGQERPIDAIIFGTGFTPSDPLPRNVLFGRDGVDLLDTWPEGPEAYKGTMTAGFPNLFFLMGPNTGLGHNSMVYMIESQIHYILGALNLLNNRQLASLEPKREAQDAFNGKIQNSLGKTVWNAGGCNSWYLHPVSGRNCTVWPGFTWRYRLLTRNFDPAAYHFSRLSPAHPAQKFAIASQTITEVSA